MLEPLSLSPTHCCIPFQLPSEPVDLLCYKSTVMCLIWNASTWLHMPTEKHISVFS